MCFCALQANEFWVSQHFTHTMCMKHETQISWPRCWTQLESKAASPPQFHFSTCGPSEPVPPKLHGAAAEAPPKRPWSHDVTHGVSLDRQVFLLRHLQEAQAESSDCKLKLPGGVCRRRPDITKGKFTLEYNLNNLAEVPKPQKWDFQWPLMVWGI